MKQTELKKIIKNVGFEAQLKPYGFTMAKSGLWFYRRRDWLVDAFCFWITSSGNFVAVPAFSECIDYIENYDFSNFPKDYLKHNRYFSDAIISRDGTRIGGPRWKIENSDLATQSMIQLLSAIEETAIPWFNNITTIETLIESYASRFYELEESAAIFADMRANAHKYKPLT